MFNYALALTLFLICALCGCYLLGSADATVVKVLATLLGISALVAGIGCFVKGEKI